jgi:hypothetical protein
MSNPKVDIPVGYSGKNSSNDISPLSPTDESQKLNE